MRKSIVIFVAIVTILNIFPRIISAQAGCSITSVTLTGDTGTQSIAYTDGANAYVNVQTSGCSTNLEIQLSVLENDPYGENLVLDYIIFNPGNETAQNVNSFTIPLFAGDSGCDSGECNYFARIYSVSFSNTQEYSNEVSYSCDGECDTAWQSNGESQAYGYVENSNNQNNNNQTNQNNTAGSTSINITVNNPLTGVNSINEFLERIIELALKLGIPIIALMIIYAGFLYVTARGDTGKIKTAHKAFLNAIIGAAILLGAWVIVQIIDGTIDAITGSI